MSVTYLALAALVLSAIAILLLCIGDPKRRRAGGGKGDRDGGMTPGARRVLVAAACLPGLACALLGEAAAFLMWLGGSALLGWLLAACFRPGPASE